MDLTEIIRDRKTLFGHICEPLTEEQRVKFKDGLTEQGFQHPREQYDQYGLRFDMDYLNHLGGAICLMPLEFMSEYVDVICKDEIDNDGELESDIMKTEIGDDRINTMNATALGNIAYILLHSKRKEVKTKLLNVLERYVNFYLDSLIENLTNQAKERPVD